jgi:hypothetical protein
MSTSPASWLFVLGDESIWIMHGANGATFVYGPGELQQYFQFSSDAARDAYQVSMTERLLGDGWVLWGADRDRRVGGERRRASRDTPDRRSPRPGPGTDDGS